MHTLKKLLLGFKKGISLAVMFHSSVGLARSYTTKDVPVVSTEHDCCSSKFPCAALQDYALHGNVL